MSLDAETKRGLQAKLRAFYERELSDGQRGYFTVRDGMLRPTPMGRHWLAEHLLLFQQLLELEPGERFLDVGCGEGYYTIPLAARAEFSIGADVSSSVLRLLQSLRSYDPARLLGTVTDVEALPFANATFDKALCSHLLEHVLDDRLVMAEIHRVVKPGGVAVFAVPLKYTVPYRVVRAAERAARTVLRPGKQAAPVAPPGELDMALVGRQAHIRHYSVPVFCSRLEAQGWSVRAVRGVWFHDPRNWLVNRTQPNRFFYEVGTRLSKLAPDLGAAVVVRTTRE